MTYFKTRTHPVDLSFSVLTFHSCQSINHSINQSIDRSVSQSVNRSPLSEVEKLLRKSSTEKLEADQSNLFIKKQKQKKNKKKNGSLSELFFPSQGYHLEQCDSNFEFIEQVPMSDLQK